MDMSFGRFQPDARVIVDGTDLTGPLLKKASGLEIVDKAGIESDKLRLRLEDTGPARIAEPPEGAEIRVWLGYRPSALFMGLFVVDDVSSEGPPDVVEIDASAAPMGQSSGGMQPVTTHRSRSWPAGTRLGDLVDRVASDLGLEPGASASVADLKLPHVDQIGESDINLVTRLARDLDVVAKVGGGRLILARRGESVSVGGSYMPVTRLDRQDISRWRSGRLVREPVGTVIAVCRDLGSGEEIECRAGSGEPVRRLRHAYPDEATATRAAEAELSRSGRAARELSLKLPGNPGISAEGIVAVSRLRPELDGRWLVTSVIHRFDRGGFVSDVRLEKPPAT